MVSEQLEFNDPKHMEIIDMITTFTENFNKFFVMLTWIKLFPNWMISKGFDSFNGKMNLSSNEPFFVDLTGREKR